MNHERNQQEINSIINSLLCKSHKSNKINNYWSSGKAVEELKKHRINKNSGTKQDGTQ